MDPLQQQVIPPVPPSPASSPIPSPATPPVSPPPPPTFTSPLVPKHSSAKKWIAILVILVILGAGAYLANSAGLFTSPEAQLKEAILLSQDIKKTNLKILTDVEYNLPAGKQFMQLSIEGASDVTDKTNPQLDLKLKFNGMGIVAEGDMKIIDKTLYFKINQLPLPASYPMEILNKWFSFTEADAKKLAEETGRDYSFMNLESQGQLKYSQEEIYNLMEQYKVIQSVSSKGFSDVEGTKTRSLEAKFSLDAFFDVVLAIIKKDSNNPLSNLPQAEINKIKELYAKIIVVNPVTFEIGVLDGQIHGIKTSFIVNDPRGSSENPTITKEVGRIGIKISYSDINKDVKIEMPTESQPFIDLILGSLEQARIKGSDAVVKANLSQLRAQMEVFYDKGMTYAGACNSKEVKNYLTDIQSRVPKSVPVCKAIAQSYIIFSTLSNNSYYCIDSTGASKELAKAPTGNVCK